MSKIFLFQAIQFSQTVLFKTIQFSISTQFSSIWSLDRALSGATTPGHSGPGSDGNEGDAPHSPKLQHHWNLMIRLISDISRTLICGGVLTPLQKNSRCILQPQPTRKVCVCVCVCVCVWIVYTFYTHGYILLTLSFASERFI